MVTQQTNILNQDPAIVRDTLYRIKRGLCGYVSYLAACEMNQAFSEYVLYEPILRVLTARQYTVQCEFECPGIVQPRRGDKKRLDFYATSEASSFALEVKWAKSAKPDIRTDTEKLRAFSAAQPQSLALLLIFGTRSNIEPIVLAAADYRERGHGVYADFGVTRYGCRVFEFRSAP